MSSGGISFCFIFFILCHPSIDLLDFSKITGMIVFAFGVASR